MKHADTVLFLSPEKLREKVSGMFEREQCNIQRQFPGIDVQNVGSSAIPGAIGKFDVDIQIRISQDEYVPMVKWMSAYAEAKNPDRWTLQYAEFKNAAGVIDYNITVIGSRHDVFYRIRDYLICNPEVLDEYNQLKMHYHGKTYGEYRQARHHFFKEIKTFLR